MPGIDQGSAGGALHLRALSCGGEDVPAGGIAHHAAGANLLAAGQLID